jgi:hypothetical protein
MIEIIPGDQGTDEWKQLRIGSIGGSSIQAVCAKGQGKSRKSLMYRFAGEILSGCKYDGYSNSDMQRGLEQEPDARAAYEWIEDVETEQVALVRSAPGKHYSPDALVSNDGIVEIKCVIPSVQVETIIQGKIPAAYRKQCQWGLHICEREWVDFVSYSPLVKDRDVLIIKAYRDEALIKEMDKEADAFLMELAMMINGIRNAK